MKLLQLQKEVRELRQKNFSNQKDIQYNSFNIISNNLYINNSSNKSSKLPKNNYVYNSFILEKEYERKKYLEQKKRSPFGKIPIKKGMFSYKTLLNNDNNNYSYNNMYKNNSNNIIEVKEPNYYYNNKYNNNNSLLSAELKLNLDDNDNYNYNENDNTEQNKGLGERVFSASSLNLNKYKINKNNIINQKNNILTPNYQVNNNSNRMLNNSTNYYPNNNYNNYTNNNSNLYMNKSQILKQNSNKIEPKNNLSMVVGNKKKKIRKIADHFKYNPINERESRRMIIEYIKILNKKENKNKKIYSLEDIENIMKKNKISQKVLNKEYSPEQFNSMNLFNNSKIFEKNKEINPGDASLRKNLLNNNSFDNNIIFNYNEVNNKSNQKVKNILSPIKKNIDNFLIKMNDSKDKMNILAFLSTPRIMNLYFLDKKYKLICVLCPNNICYVEAIENYIFKFTDIKKKQNIGGFDLIKVKICTKIPNKPNNFYIKTFDGKIDRNYEFETKSPIIANNYVKAISYLTQLVKCNLYNFKNNYKEKMK